MKSEGDFIDFIASRCGFPYKIAIDNGPCATLLSSNLSALSAKFGDLNELKEMTPFVFSCEPHAVLA